MSRDRRRAGRRGLGGGLVAVVLGLVVAASAGAGGAGASWDSADRWDCTVAPASAAVAPPAPDRAGAHRADAHRATARRSVGAELRSDVLVPRRITGRWGHRVVPLGCAPVAVGEGPAVGTAGDPAVARPRSHRPGDHRDRAPPA